MALARVRPYEPHLASHYRRGRRETAVSPRAEHHRRPENSRAVRQLIMKRLVTKDPSLRVMNRTFQRFVVSPQSGGQLAQTDVARIEGELGASVWDQFRAPFALAVVGVAAFLFLTQRETYNTTVGAVVGLSTQIPNILKTLTMMAQKEPSGLSGQRNV